MSTNAVNLRQHCFLRSPAHLLYSCSISKVFVNASPFLIRVSVAAVLKKHRKYTVMASRDSHSRKGLKKCRVRNVAPECSHGTKRWWASGQTT